MFGLIRTRFINMHDHIRYILLIYKSKIWEKKTQSLNETVWFKFSRDLTAVGETLPRGPRQKTEGTRRIKNQRKLGQLFQ